MIANGLNLTIERRIKESNEAIKEELANNDSFVEVDQDGKAYIEWMISFYAPLDEIVDYEVMRERGWIYFDEGYVHDSAYEGMCTACITPLPEWFIHMGLDYMEYVRKIYAKCLVREMRKERAIAMVKTLVDLNNEWL